MLAAISGGSSSTSATTPYHPAVAVCFGGQLRSLKHSAASLNKFVINQLKADVFITTDAISNRTSRTDIAPLDRVVDVHVDHFNLDELREHAVRSALIDYNFSDFSPYLISRSKSEPYNATGAWPDNCITLGGNGAFQMWRRFHCGQRIREHEMRYKFSYEFIVYARTDMLWSDYHAPIAHFTADPNVTAWNGPRPLGKIISDFHIVTTRAAALEQWESLLDHYSSLRGATACGTGRRKGNLGPELALADYFRWKKVQVCAFAVESAELQGECTDQTSPLNLSSFAGRHLAVPGVPAVQ